MQVAFYLVCSLCLALGIGTNGRAQNQTLRFEHLGIEDGLSNENVTQIFQDSKGYLWIGTFDGLNKYDGYAFTRYRFDPFDSNSLSQNFIYTIYEDKQGSIWVSSFEGLCKLDRYTGNFTRYKPAATSKFSDPNISVISEDRDGMLWVGSHSGGLCRFNPKTGTFLPGYFALGYDALPENKPMLKDDIHCICKDRAGTLWVGNNTGLHKMVLTAAKRGGLSGVSFQDFKHDPSDRNTLSSNNITSILEDRSGYLWVATQNGLNRFDPKTGNVKRYMHDPENNQSISSNNMELWFGSHLAEDQEGNLWICTDNGLNKLNKDRTVFTRYGHNPGDPYSLSSDLLCSIRIDQEGVLWTGSWKGKLNKANLHTKPFGLIRHDPDNPNSLSSNQVTALLEDSKGMVWIGTYGGGLNRWEKKNNRFTQFRCNPRDPKTLRSDAVHTVFEDRQGGLWIGNGDVLSHINRQTGECTHYQTNDRQYKDEDHRIIFSITEDRLGFLWLGTGNGVKRFDKKTGTFKHYYHNPADTTGLSDYIALVVFADSRNNLWIGHGSKGTDRLNLQTGRFTHFIHNPRDSTAISSNYVNCISEDSRGNLWLGTTAGGLCRYDVRNGKFTTFTTRHGLPGNSVYSVLEDNNNHLWIGTGNGLSRFDPVTGTFTNYDYKDGLQGNFFAAGEDRERGARCKGKDGTLYFGGNQGFNFFDPRQLKPGSHQAPVVITQFKIFDKLQQGANEKNELVLEHSQNYFSFEFSSLSYYNPAKNQYAYKLAGVDKAWVNSGSRHYAAYTNIDPGTYRFSVRATNNDGIWNNRGTYMTIIIKPPWWRTWWAYTLFALAVAAGIYTLFRYRLKRLRMQHEIVVQKHKATGLEMQALRAQMNPHFIFNSLNSVNRFILQNNKAQASEYLTKFSKLVRLILQNSQSAMISLERELEALRLYLQLEAVRFDHHFHYSIHVADDLDVDAIKVPPLMIQPFAENAIWHGLMHKNEQGHLEIRLFEEQGLLCCRIADDGVGRKKAAELKSKSASADKSMGMQITADRIAVLQQGQQHPGSIAITDLQLPDGSAGGTEVMIRLPY